MYRRIQKVYMGGIDCSGGLVRVVTEQLPAADMQAVTPDFQVAGNPDTVLDGSYHTFRIGNVLRIGFQDTGVSNAGFETVIGTEPAGHVTARFLQVIQQQTATSGTALSRNGSGNGGCKTVSGILQSQTGLVAFLDAVRMLVVLFLLGIEKVMVQLCIDGIAQALLVEGFYIGMQLYAHLV